MRRFAVASAVAAALVTGAAHAQVVKDKKSCEQAVADAKQALSEATIGPKAIAEAEDLIRISEHLCTQANFVYVEKLLAISRGITAAE